MKTSTPRFSLFCWATALVYLVLSVSSWSFTNVSIGSTIASAEMPTLDGGTHPLLGNERVNVVLFFRPDQEHSRKILREVGLLVQEFEGKSVHFVAIVSSLYNRERVREVVDRAELDIPVLVDGNDALSGKLGVPLHPVVGITDQDHVLKAYQYFTKINFSNFLRAHILYELEEISEAKLDKALNPPRAVKNGSFDPAQANLKLSRMLFKAGNLEKALERARKSLEHNPDQAEAHALEGAILAAQDDCPGALAAFERALGLDPGQSIALEGKKACLGGS